MIVSTSKSDALIRKALGKKKSTIISFDKMIEQFAVDPEIAKPKRDLYIVASDDLITNRLRQQFEAAAAGKHPNVKIIFINKQAKPVFPDGCTGVDKIITKPKSEDLINAIGEVLGGEAQIGEVEERVVGNGTLDKINQSTKRDNVGKSTYKLRREKELASKRRVLNTISATGHPVEMIAAGLYITRDDEDKFYLVERSGEFKPTVPSGDPVEVDELGYPVNPAIVKNEEDGRTAVDAQGFAIIDEEIAAKIREEAEKNAQAILQSNPNNLETVEEVESQMQASMTEAGEPLPIGDGIGVPDFVEPGSPATIADIGSNIKNRIESSNVTEVSIMLREMAATELVKDLIQSNSTYSGIEEKLLAIKDSIFAIWNDQSSRTLDEKLNKIHALMHDKAFFRTTGDTLIEQRLEDIIDSVVNNCRNYVGKRTEAIHKLITDTWGRYQQDTPAKLAGIADKRADIIAELYALQLEIGRVSQDTDRIIIDTANYIAKENLEFSGDDEIDDHIMARGANVISSTSVAVISKAVDYATTLPDKFGEMEHMIRRERECLRELFKIDEDFIEAQNALVRRYETKNPTDQVVIQKLIKQVLNVFVAEANTGRTIVPYLISNYQSRTPRNVLLIDLTQESKFDAYNIPVIEYDDFVNDMRMDQLCVVRAQVPNDVVAAQQLMTVLLKAADFYGVINVVMTTEQNELFNIIAPDVRVVNYIVDTVPTHIDTMKKYINSINLENVGQRVIINKCNVAILPVLRRLGMENSTNYQIVKIDDIPSIADASLKGYDPYEIGAVAMAFKEIMRNVKS